MMKRRWFLLSVLIFLGLILLILVFLPVQFVQFHDTRSDLSLKPFVIAHRGASGLTPENTIASFKKALDSDADCIELDVHLSKDAIPVVIHDVTVDRTTNGKGLVKDMELNELRKLDAGSWFPESYIGETIPMLEEVITLIAGKKKLLIEIKKGADFYPGIEKAVDGLISKYDAYGWCIVQSFNDDVLELFHLKFPEIRLHKLIIFKFRFLPFILDTRLHRFNIQNYSYTGAINIHHLFASRTMIRKIHDSGKKVNVWGSKDSQGYRKALDRGADGIITNFP